MNRNDWKTCPPPVDVLLWIKCDDYTGEYRIKARRVDYKKPRKGRSAKGFRTGWRWITENGKTIDRKEYPSAWAHIEN